jgi:hypothetical protein
VYTGLARPDTSTVLVADERSMRTFFRREWEGHGRFVGRRHDTHVSMRQGHIEWCPIIVACVRQYAPHVTVWANTGGTFGVRRG